MANSEHIKYAAECLKLVATGQLAGVGHATLTAEPVKIVLFVYSPVTAAAMFFIGYELLAHVKTEN